MILNWIWNKSKPLLKRLFILILCCSATKTAPNYIIYNLAVSRPWAIVFFYGQTWAIENLNVAYNLGLFTYEILLLCLAWFFCIILFMGRAQSKA